ncbi:acyl-CoA synthetase [Acrocarpospora phusangensis]|uniref:Acyl-CoA synthetase n=1 Tax=Acrocarpospora phusangensis TaxID=1070424 RepID=A0A919QJR3_9ACTN|nr:long-chain-fatty-acid--CoA ligase [Acrocarpospora phusangensis]GIH28710.1 acyl-CoA synthetase [Acrocarpospora phusangensis]
MSSGIADLLRASAARAPESPVVTGDGRPLTYGELDARSSRAAAALAELPPGSRVGYVDRNATEYFELLFGAAKAGVVLVPLNFRLAPDEMRWILDDADVSLVVAGTDHVPLLDGLSVPLIAVGDAYEDWLAAHPPADPRRDAAGDDLVVLMYSSGTTGRPKGVHVTAAGLAAAVDLFGAAFKLGPDTVSLVPIPYYHIAGAGWALITVAEGGTLVQCREPTPQSMLAQLVDFRVTHTAMVPAVIQIMTDLPAAATADFSRLQQIVYGASPISESLLSRAVALFGAEFFQSYGLTETIGVTTLLGPDQHIPGNPVKGRLRSAGRAVPGMEVAVADLETGEPAEPGVVGEVIVRGPCVTTGYWRNPAETDAAFLPGGWLRTGDAGSLDADGYLYLHDRIKDMIVSGGENVYPAEVESALAGHPAVQECAVIGVPSPRWGETPLAYVVLRPGAETAGEELLAWTRDRLAHYKCPTQVVFTGLLPRNPSGKILKRELRRPWWEEAGRGIG